jgi:hypothetical protein
VALSVIKELFFMSRAAALYLRFPYDPSLLPSPFSLLPSPFSLLPSPFGFRQYFLSEGATLSIIKNNSFMTDDATPLRTFQNILCFVIKKYILYDR